MKLRRLLVPVLGLFAFLPPSLAFAQVVTFKATGTISETFGYTEEVRTAFLTRFPLGTSAEMIYTFDVSTAPLGAGSPSFPAISALSVRVGDYTATTATLPVTIHIQNDVGLLATKPGVSLPCLPEGGTLFGDLYSINSVETSGSIPDPDPVPGFGAVRQFVLQLKRECLAGTNPLTGMFPTGELTTTPPDLGMQAPEHGLWMSWRDGNGWADIFVSIDSLIVVPATNTGSGQDVIVSPPVTLPDGTAGGVSLKFDNVATPGDTTVVTTAAGAPPPSGFKLTNPPVYYEITTTAVFTGGVRLCLGWSEGQIANESMVKMFHHEGNRWVDITDETSRDSVANTVCGRTTSFSPFAMFDVKHPFTGFFSPVDNAPVINSAKAGSAVPVKFSLGGDLGLAIFAPGFPKVAMIQCPTGALIDAVEETSASTTSGLQYDQTSGRYTYVWKTDKGWAGSCRELQLRFNDGETYRARFTMAR